MSSWRMTSSKGHYIKLLATTKNIKKSCPKIFLHGRESRKRVVTSDQDAWNWDRSGATALRDDDGFVICKEQEQKTKQQQRVIWHYSEPFITVLALFFYPCPTGLPLLTCTGLFSSMPISLYEQSGRQEEGSADHRHEGTEQQRQLQWAELPQVGVSSPQRVRNLREAPSTRRQ